MTRPGRLGPDLGQRRPQPRPLQAPALGARPAPAARRGPAPCCASSGARRGVLILPGLGNNKQDYAPLAELLRQKDLAVGVAEVSRVDWLRNAAGLTDPNYWRGTLSPRPVVDWYLNRVDAGLKAVAQEAGGGPVALLAHSAGGWLARVYLLGYGPQGLIDKLLTLGSPHLPPPEGSRVVDQTRGILTYVEQNCPGRFHEEIQYISVAGRFIRGARFRDRGASLRQKVVGLGYQQVCGEAAVWGDGVVPEPAAHLPGALQITLEDVYHSPVGAVDGSGEQQGRLWYGSAPVLERWLGHLTDDVDFSPGGSAGVTEVEALVDSAVAPRSGGGEQSGRQC